MPSETVLMSQKYERVTDYETGIRDFLATIPADMNIDAVGFKTVLSKDHYGVHIIDDDVIKGMEEYMVVAPAHNTFILNQYAYFKSLCPAYRW